MKSIINRSYTGTQIVCTQAIAALKSKLVFKNIVPIWHWRNVWKESIMS